MQVIHILKDGSVVEDITGHVVRMEDATPLYQLIDKINRERSKKKQVHNNDSREKVS